MNPVTPEALVALLADSGVLPSEAPTAAARERTLAAAMAARGPGRPAAAVPATTPVGALRATIAELADVLDSLPAESWSAPVPAYPGWTVAGLVAHLLGVERYVGRNVGLWSFTVDPAIEDDHLAVTAPVQAEWQGRSGPEVAAAWHESAVAVAEHAAGSDEDALATPVRYHQLTPSLASLLVVRVFEIWTHTDDIRAAVGLPLQAPDPARLALMTELAVGVLPLGMELEGRPRPGRTARVVLTGPGGGTWVTPLGPDGPDRPDTTLVADVVDFCRVAARRLEPAALDVVVEGDADLVMDMLVGVAAFAA